MAVTKTILRNVHQEAAVKVAGTVASATIDLSVDLLNTGLVLDGDTQAVNIVGVVWTGNTGGVITITRNDVTIMTLQAAAAGMLYFDGQTMVPESVENTSDIVVNISGAQAECWLKLRKVSGYKTTVEPEQFGHYDNPSVAGS
jgi:hypothetical protein